MHCPGEHLDIETHTGVPSRSQGGKPKCIEQGRFPKVDGSHEADSLNRLEIERMGSPLPHPGLDPCSSSLPTPAVLPAPLGSCVCPARTHSSGPTYYLSPIYLPVCLSFCLSICVSLVHLSVSDGLQLPVVQPSSCKCILLHSLKGVPAPARSRSQRTAFCG